MTLIHRTKRYRQTSANQYLYLITCCIIIVLWNNVSALTEERIVGGTLANHTYFKYQAIVLGKRNYTEAFILFGSGVIISDYFVLSAAQCVLSKDGHLKRFSFFVTVGTNIVKRYKGIFVQVERMFVAPYDAATNLNDLVVLKTAESFNLTNSDQLQALNLPRPYESFGGAHGVVSGYGFNKVEVEYNRETGRQQNGRGESDDKLRFAPVHISHDFRCKKWYPDIHPRKQMCGTIPRLEELPWGLCTSDIGSPLVINQTIVGIASRITLNCDDSISGCIYTKISAYSTYIYNIMNGTADIVISYENYPHELTRPLGYPFEE